MGSSYRTPPAPLDLLAALTDASPEEKQAPISQEDLAVVSQAIKVLEGNRCEVATDKLAQESAVGVLERRAMMETFVSRYSLLVKAMENKSELVYAVAVVHCSVLCRMSKGIQREEELER
eukprot:763596-Hanusia_phi.AAC.6